MGNQTESENIGQVQEISEKLICCAPRMMEGARHTFGKVGIW